MNKTLEAFIKSPEPAGLFLLLLAVAITGCEPVKTPEQVTLAFWRALSEVDLPEAESYLSEDSRGILTPSSLPAIKNASIETGRIIIDGNRATVKTQIRQENSTGSIPAFQTALVQENEHWKIDYKQTLNNISGNVFGGFFKSLENIGNKLNEQLEKQLPIIEKGFDAFGKELEKQVDEFGRQLDKALPQEPPEKTPGSI